MGKDVESKSASGVVEFRQWELSLLLYQDCFGARSLEKKPEESPEFGVLSGSHSASVNLLCEFLEWISSAP